MKKFLLTIILVFCLIPYLNAEEKDIKDISEQLDFQTRWLRYESEKKGVANGILFSLILPGGGYFYAEENSYGLGFLTIEAALLWWYFYALKSDIDNIWGDENFTENYKIPGTIFLIVRVIEFIGISQVIDDYNSNLKKKLNLESQIDFHIDKINLSLVYKF